MFKYLSNVFRTSPGGREEHHAIIDSIMRELETLEEDVGRMRLEMFLLTATGDWLDNWGTWFNVERDNGESDEDYRHRIIGSTTRPKSTIPAIKHAIENIALYDSSVVRVYEPYRNVFKWGQSEYSGRDVYQDGDYWRWGTVDIKSPYVLNDKIRKAVRRTVSAGITIFFTKIEELHFSREERNLYGETEVTIEQQSFRGHVDVFISIHVEKDLTTPKPMRLLRADSSLSLDNFWDLSVREFTQYREDKTRSESEIEVVVETI